MEILKDRPDNIFAYYELGNVFQDKGQLDEAILCYRKAIETNPHFTEPYNNLGNVYRKKGRLDEAETYYRIAVKAMPDFFGSYYNLGETLREKGLLDEAIECYRKALTLNPGHVATMNNLGTALREKGEIESAIACYRQAILLNPHVPESHSNLAHALLLLGHLEEGWREYDWRLKMNDYLVPGCPDPPADELSLKGKKVFVCAEQGIGDEIMSASCVRNLIDRSESCTIECDRRLLRLFSRSFPEAAFTERAKEEGAHSVADVRADVRMPAWSIPRFLRPKLSSFPGYKAYLVPDEQEVRDWRKRLDKLGEGLKVGLSWRGGPTPEIIRLRSIALTRLSEIFSMPGVHFVNLQYGNCSAELKEAQEKMGVTIHTWDDADPLKDLDGFAAQIAALDLIISVDNSTVHMAGALGVPVWVLLSFVPNWRWMLGRKDSPWYPSARLFRQRAPGDWTPVITEVSHELRKKKAG
jgi:Tfp pilus assembly protein PilF